MTLMLSLDRPTRRGNDEHRTRLATFDAMSEVGRAAARYLVRQSSRGLARDRGVAAVAARLAELAGDAPAGPGSAEGRQACVAGVEACLAAPMGPFDWSGASALKAMVFAVTARPSGFATETVARVEDWRALHRLLGVAAMQHCGIVAWAPETKPSRRRLGPDRVPVDASPGLGGDGGAGEVGPDPSVGDAG